jgi:hypothetical protein
MWKLSLEMGIVYFKVMAHSWRMMVSKCIKRNRGPGMHMMNGKYFAQLYLTFRILYGCVLL